MSRHTVTLTLSVVCCSLLSHGPSWAAASLELYGTINSMGAIVSIASSDDSNRNAVATPWYRRSGSGTAYRQGFTLTRTSATRFVGSLFWLSAGSSYDVRIDFADPDGPLGGSSISGTAATRAEPAVPAASTSYHVSPSGNGSACSPGSPCALAEGISRAQAGDEVVLHGGAYYAGDISLPRSGSAGAPIVIRAASGETPVLDGADPTSSAWSSQGGGVYRTTVSTADPHLIVANGQRLLPYQSLSDLQNLVWGVPGFYVEAGTTVYVRLSGGADPNGASIAISRFNTAFYTSRNFIYFLDLTFRHYGQGSYAKAIYFYNGSDNLVRGCTFATNDLGIGLKYASHRNVIESCTFSDTLFDWPWDAFYAGIDLSSGGIRFYSPTSGRGNIIRRNVFHDLFDGFGCSPDSTGGVTNETDVYENTVYRAGDDGMETDGEASNVRIWGNTFHDVLVGISVAPVYTGPVYAIRNLIHRTGAGNNNYTGTPFKFNSGYAQSGPIYLFHNTGDAALAGNNGLHIKSPGSWTLIQARNNIWAGTDYALDDYNTGNPTDLDYDGLWTTSASRLVRWNSTNYSTLASFSAATGQETHGLNTAPGFANAGGGDYRLSGGSPLIDRGLWLPGINDDFQGGGPDIGAFETSGGGGGCTYTVGAFPLSFGAGGGTASVSVSTQDGCAWSAVSNQAWASLSPATGTGAGSTLLTVETNAGAAARTAELVIAGRSFTIVQDGTSGGGPVITSVKSKTSKPGKPATIRGSGFVPSKGGNRVYFGTKPAKLKRASASRLTVTIPKGVRGTVDVYVVAGGRESNRISFVVKQE